LGSSGGQLLELIGAEAVRKMYGNYSNEQDERHWNTGEGNKRPDKHGQSAEQLNNNRRPRQQRGSGHSESVQDIGKVVRTSRKLCVAVLHEAVADDQTDWDRVPSLLQRGEKAGAAGDEIVHTGSFA
jgi:hypothetical protein